MGFETLVLNDIEQTKGEFAPPPQGTYTLRLLGVKPSQFKEGQLDFDMAIDEGSFKGRRVFPTLPAPASNDAWSAQAAAKFASVLGIEQQPNEPVMDLFNRAAQNGHSRFTATLEIDTYISKQDNQQKSKSKMGWFSVAPAV